jgi:hypothetical protein
MGWVICRKQSIEEAEESALTYITNVADLHRAMLSLRSWVP